MDYTIAEFFEAVEKNQVSLLEQHNYLQKITDNFDDYKMGLLSKDFQNLYLKSYGEISEGAGVYIEEDEDENKPVKIVFSTPEKIHEEAIKRLRILQAEVEAQIIMKQLVEIDLHEDPQHTVAKIDEGAEEHPEIDLSGTPVTEKLIYLKELGIIDFLLTKDPFNMSIRKLALALTPILGEKYGTIQPIINPMAQNKFSKNNPYFSPSGTKVEKIRQHLIELGVELNNNSK